MVILVSRIINYTNKSHTGQEIVSRVEHIGKTARRAALFACGKALPAGSDITDAGGTVAGTVVLSAAAGSKAAVLAQVAADKTADTYRADEAVLTALSLPYSYSRSDK